MKITPLLIVQQIEDSLPFWIDRMGFEKVVNVPEGDKLGFVILAQNGVELMLQTASSVAKDIPQFAPKAPLARASLFMEVDNFEETVKRLKGYPITMPERVALYGMREIGVFDPGGHIVVFAARL